MPAFKILDEGFAELCTNIKDVELSKYAAWTMQDFHGSDGNRLLSGGMDHSIKMWNLAGAAPLCLPLL